MSSVTNRNSISNNFSPDLSTSHNLGPSQSTNHTPIHDASLQDVILQNVVGYLLLGRARLNHEAHETENGSATSGDSTVLVGTALEPPVTRAIEGVNGATLERTEASNTTLPHHNQTREPSITTTVSNPPPSYRSLDIQDFDFATDTENGNGRLISKQLIHDRFC